MTIPLQKVMEWIKKLSNKITPCKVFSHYSDSMLSLFGEYCHKPLCSLLLITSEEHKILGINIAQTFISVLKTISRITVLLKFDRPRQPRGRPILPWVFYVVNVEKHNLILFPNKFDFVLRMVRQYADHIGIKYKVKGQLIPP